MAPTTGTTEEAAPARPTPSTPTLTHVTAQQWESAQQQGLVVNLFWNKFPWVACPLRTSDDQNDSRRLL